MLKKTPLAIVTERGGKEKLVDDILGIADRGDEDKDEFKARLLKAPNSKLLRMHAALTEVRQRFGSKEKLVDAILAADGRAKDRDLRTKLGGYTPARLLDMHRAASRRAKRRAA